MELFSPQLFIKHTEHGIYTSFLIAIAEESALQTRVHNKITVWQGENALLSCSTSWYYGGLFGAL